MKLISCHEQKHSQPILDIFNEAIANSTALYDYKPRTLESMGPWFASKRQNNFPVIGLEGDNGELLGFASYGAFRPHPAYKYSVEHSIYIQKDHRGKGLGAVLLQAIIKEAEAQEFHLMIGGIDASNQASIALHEKFGFEHSGTVREAGFKFGRWLNLAFYQKILAGPAHAVDG